MDGVKIMSIIVAEVEGDPEINVALTCKIMGEEQDKV